MLGLGGAHGARLQPSGSELCMHAMPRAGKSSVTLDLTWRVGVSLLEDELNNARDNGPS
jgi:hypothetical protein